MSQVYYIYVTNFTKFDIYHIEQTQRARAAMYCTVCTCPGAIRLCLSNLAVRMGHIFLVIIQATSHAMNTGTEAGKPPVFLCGKRVVFCACWSTYRNLLRAILILGNIGNYRWSEIDVGGKRRSPPWQDGDLFYGCRFLHQASSHPHHLGNPFQYRVLILCSSR